MTSADLVIDPAADSAAGQAITAATGYYGPIPTVRGMSPDGEVIAIHIPATAVGQASTLADLGVGPLGPEAVGHWVIRATDPTAIFPRRPHHRSWEVRRVASDAEMHRLFRRMTASPATDSVREASEIVAHARAYLAWAEDARDRAIRDALAAGMTGAAVAAATQGTGAEIREMRVSQIRRGVRA